MDLITTNAPLRDLKGQGENRSSSMFLFIDLIYVPAQSPLLRWTSIVIKLLIGLI